MGSDHGERCVPLSHTQYRMGFRPSEADAARRHEVAENKARLTGPKTSAKVERQRQTRRDEMKAKAAAEKERLYAIVESKRAAAVAAKAVSGVNCDPSKKETKETFKSQFKIGWASKSTGQTADMSSYQDLQCGNYNQLLATLKAGAEKARGSTVQSCARIPLHYSNPV